MCGLTACRDKYETWRGQVGGVAHDTFVHNAVDFSASKTGRADAEFGKNGGETPLPLVKGDPGFEPPAKRRRAE